MAIYVAIVIGRLSEAIPGLGSIPVAKIAFALALFGMFGNPDSLSKTPLGSIPTARVGFWFFGWATFTFVFSIWKSASLQAILDTLLTLTLSFIFIIKSGSSWSSIKALHTGFVGAAGLLALNTLLSYSGGRAGSVGSYDPNDTAFVLVTLTPFVVSFALNSKGIKRLSALGLALVMILCILLTQSRGGLLGLGAIMIGMTLFPLSRPLQNDRKKTKGMGVLSKVAVMLLAAMVVWTFLPAETRGRLSTIVSPKDDYNMNMKEEGRLAIWMRNLQSVEGRPIGFGINTFGMVDLRSGGQFRAAHNSLVQILVELGILGLIFYLRAYAVAWKALKPILVYDGVTTKVPLDKSVVVLARGLRLSIVGSFICGFFLSQGYSNLIWLMIAMIAAVTSTAVSVNGLTAKSGSKPRLRIRRASRKN